MTETVQIRGLLFEVRRSARRRTFGLTLDRSGELVVHCPLWAADESINQWATSRLLWVHRKLALKDQFASKFRNPEFVSGESFCYLGHRYRLRINRVQKEPLRFDGRVFFLRPDIGEQPNLFRDWYIRTGSPWFAERVEFLAARTPHRPSRITVRDLGFRWGSCGKNNALFFNWKILQLPIRLVDYVIAHELTHLEEHKHTPNFWRSLERAMPDWRERKETLAVRAKDFMVFGITSDM
jgi:predicted metal-dependent hydrolase